MMYCKFGPVYASHEPQPVITHETNLMPPKVTMHPVDHQRILYYTYTYNHFVFTSSFFVIYCQAIKLRKFYVILISPRSERSVTPDII